MEFISKGYLIVKLLAFKLTWGRRLASVGGRDGANLDSDSPVTNEKR